MASIVEITSNPRFQKATPEQKQKLISMASDFTQDPVEVVKQSAKDVFTKPAAYVKKVGTDPVEMAKAIPPAVGLATMMSGNPVGLSYGTVAARQLISNPALRLLGKEKEIPSTTAQVLEGAGALAGDIALAPSIMRKILGPQVGLAEKAAKFPAKETIESIPMSLGPKSLGDFINDAFRSLPKGFKGTPRGWMQLKDQVDRIYELGKTGGLTSLDRIRLRELNNVVQKGLNSLAPGRQAPAAALARSQMIPNAVKRTVQKLPSSVKAGLGVGAGGAGIGALSYALGKKVFGRDERR